MWYRIGWTRNRGIAPATELVYVGLLPILRHNLTGGALKLNKLAISYICTRVIPRKSWISMSRMEDPWPGQSTGEPFAGVICWQALGRGNNMARPWLG